jgi:MFS transporter, DHA1 family, solute carrier family 18 (vesicular amine transporter), member 1/2
MAASEYVIEPHADDNDSDNDIKFASSNCRDHSENVGLLNDSGISINRDSVQNEADDEHTAGLPSAACLTQSAGIRSCNVLALRNTRQGALLVMSIARFVDSVLLGMIIPLIPVYVKQNLNMSQVYVGILIAAYPFPYLVTLPVLGPWIDSVGYRVPFNIGVVMLGGSTILFMIAKSYVLLVFARTLQGLSSAVTVAASYTCVSAAYPKSQRTGANGIIMALDGLGALVGPVVGGALYEYGGHSKQLPFLVLTGIVALDGLLRVLLLPAKTAFNDNPLGSSDERVSMPTMLKHKYFVSVLVTSTLAGGNVAVIEALVPVWINKSFGATPGQIGLIFGACVIAYVLVTVMSGEIFVTRFRAYKLGIASLIIVSGVFMIFPFADSVWSFMVFGFLAGASMGLLQAFIIHAARVAVESIHGMGAYGTVFALEALGYSIGYLLCPLLSSGMAVSLSYGAAFRIWSAVLLGGIPFVLLLKGIDEKPAAL